MSTAAAEEPDPIPRRSDVAKIIRTWALDRIAHTGIMIARTNRNLHKAERIQKFAVTGDPNDLLTPEGEDDMGVYIGNEIHNHIEGGQPAASATPATPATPVTPTTPVVTEPTEPTRPEVVRPEVIQPTIVKPEVVQPVVVPAVNGKSGMLPMVALALAVLGAGGIGAGALALWNSYRSDSTVNVTENPDDDWRIGLRVQDFP